MGVGRDGGRSPASAEKRVGHAISWELKVRS